MKKSYLLIPLLLNMLVLFSCYRAKDNPFWGGGVQLFESKEIFSDERLPNIVVTTEGTILATWGRYNYRVRRSIDGGVTWQPEIPIESGRDWVHGGGVVVDENNGEVLVFTHHGDHTGNDTLVVYRSKDEGNTWQEQEVKIFPDTKGNIPTGHMSEHGVTLQYGPKEGRLLRPARWFGRGNRRQYYPEHYNTAIYSDDGGKTWYTSEPFPAYGTGEGALVELSDGRIYYNSRRHWAPEGENPRFRHIAWSYDGGETWEDLSVSEELPDGDQNRDYGLMGGLVRLPLDEHDILLFSNIDSQGGRQNGTVWVSFDGGKTWPVNRLVEEGGFAYSSMTAGRKGTSSEGMIYLLYESDGVGKIARFNLAWVTKGRDWIEFLSE